MLYGERNEVDDGYWPMIFNKLAILAIGLVALSTSCTVVIDESADQSTQPNQPTSSVDTTVVTSPSTSASPSSSSTSPTPSTTSTPSATTSQQLPVGDVPIQLPDLGAAGLVDRLQVAPEDSSIPKYERDRFGNGWDYNYQSGCNTRELVLIEESLIPAEVDDRCRPTLGRWRSAYDAVVTTDIADLQIDHFVALANAWRSGAWRWSDEQRRAYANDLTSPDTLIAVSGRSNQSKQDSSPDEWMPSDRQSWCSYAQTWVRVKARWQLSVTPAEKSALVSLLSNC